MFLTKPSLNQFPPLTFPSLPHEQLKWNVSSLSCVRLFATPWTVACQAPLSMEFSRQKYWSGLPLPSPGDLLDQGIELGSPALQADSLPYEPEQPIPLKSLLFPFVPITFHPNIKVDHLLDVYIRCIYLPRIEISRTEFSTFLALIASQSGFRSTNLCPQEQCRSTSLSTPSPILMFFVSHFNHFGIYVLAFHYNFNWHFPDD